MAERDDEQTPGAMVGAGGATDAACGVASGPRRAGAERATARMPAHLARTPVGGPDMKDPAVVAWLAGRRAEARAARKARAEAARAAPPPRAHGLVRQAAARRAERSRRLAAALEREARFRWTTAHQLTFLKVLAETGSVERASAQVGCKEQAAYRLRRVDAVFAAEWDAAQLSWRGRLAGALREAAAKAYATVAANGGFGRKPVVSERAALFLAQGLGPNGQPLGEPGSAAPSVSGLDGEEEQAALEAALKDMAERLGWPFPEDPPGAGASPAGASPAGGAGAGEGSRP